MQLIDAIVKLKEFLLGFSDTEDDCAILEEYISQLRQKKANVVVVGAFSSGKSSLINALIGYQILPMADRPLTSKRVEIFYADKPYLSCRWSSGLSQDEKKQIENCLGAIEQSLICRSEHSLHDRVLWDETGWLVEYQPAKIDCIKNILEVIESKNGVFKSDKSQDLTEKCESAPPSLTFFARIWQILLNFFKPSSRKNATEKLESPPVIKSVQIKITDMDLIRIGIPLAEEFKEICFVDLPGAGSVYSYSRNSEHAIKSAQIELHVLDGQGDIGSKLSGELIDADKNNNAVVVYVVNKKDLLTQSSLKKAIDFLHEKYNISAVTVSALYANAASQLRNDCSSISQIINNPKVNLTPVIISGAWNQENIENNRDIVYKYLVAESHISEMSNRLIESIGLMQSNILSFYSSCAADIAQRYMSNFDANLEHAKRQHKQQLVKLQEKLSKTNTVLKNINDLLDFCSNEEVCFKEFLHDEVICNIRGNLKTCVGNSLRVNFTTYEKNSKYFDLYFNGCIPQTFHQINQDIDFFLSDQFIFNIVQRACENGITLELPATPRFAWNDKNFRDRLVNSGVNIIQPILMDNSGKPWFWGKEEYRNNKIQKCLDAWEKCMCDIFEQEEKNILTGSAPLFKQIMSAIQDAKIIQAHEQRMIENEISDEQQRAAIELKHLQLRRNCLADIENFLNNHGGRE